MELYLAFKRVQYEGDCLLGVFSSEQKAEHAITMAIKKVMDERLFDEKEDNLTEFLVNLDSKWEVDRYEVDVGVTDTYGLTRAKLVELLGL